MVKKQTKVLINLKEDKKNMEEVGQLENIAKGLF